LDETQEREKLTAQVVAQAAAAAAKAVAEAANAAAITLAKENTTMLTELAVLKAGMGTMGDRQVSFECEMNKKMDELGPKFEKIYTRFDDVALGRPTWSVALILGSLFSLCVGLITFVITH